LPDLIDDGRTGILVAPDDATALSEAIDGVLTDQNRKSVLREAARADVEQRFMVSRLVSDMQDLYVELLGSKGVSLSRAR
jgi:glycosyltransferase involved in cell wall biosynthesis